MEEKNYIRKELEETAPELGRMPKGNPFSVPENYFEQLPMDVQNRIADRKKEKSGWLPLIPRWAPALAILLVIIGFGIYFISQPRQKATDNIAMQTKTNATENTGNSTVNTSAILENVDIEEDLLVTALADAKSSTKATKNSKQKELEKYVIDNYEDSQILEDL